jgi:hypothetical protein
VALCEYATRKLGDYMTGIRKRVTIGFLSIVVLLFFSGLVSLFELNNMSEDIEAILDSSRRSIELSESMLDAIRANDRAVVNYAVLRDSTYADSCRLSFETFTTKVEQARGDASSSATLLFDSLDMFANRLHSVVEQLRASRTIENLVILDSMSGGTLSFDGRRWYEQNYLPAYNSTSNSVMRVMSLAQSSLSPRAERLSRNAYRSVTPVFIALLVMIAILLMFYYFIMIYAVKPIIEMNRSLGDWLRYKLPFSVKVECQDEMLELKEKIEKVINGYKNQK